MDVYNLGATGSNDNPDCNNASPKKTGTRPAGYMTKFSNLGSLSNIWKGF